MCGSRAAPRRSAPTSSRSSTATRRARGAPWLLATAALGALFVALQGREWAALVAYGLTTSSSVYGAFFYTIVGAHALHAIAGVLVTALLWGRGGSGAVSAFALYWYFVVGLWPVLYGVVYLW